MVLGLVARLDAAQLGTIDQSFSSVVFGDVFAIKVQGDGKALIGGKFSLVNGQSRSSLARLNTNGSLDTTFATELEMTGTTVEVWSIATQSNGQILIGGRFSSVNGTNRNCLARLNVDGSLDSQFDSGSTGGQFVFATAVQQNGMIVVGGEFTSIGGVSRNGLARLNSNGSVDAFFDPSVGMNPVRTVALQPDSKILVGGAGLVRFEENGELDTSFTAGPNAFVHSISLQGDGKIVIGGDFTLIGTTTRNRIARLDTNGGLDAIFDPGEGANMRGGLAVRAVRCQPDGAVMVAGKFSTMDATPRNGLAKLNANGSLDAAFIPELPVDAEVYAFDFEETGNIILGGTLRMHNSTGNAVSASLGLSFYAGLAIEGTVGGRYRVEYSENLSELQWLPLATITLPQSPFLWIDVGSTNAPRRYYRAVIPQ